MPGPKVSLLDPTRTEHSTIGRSTHDRSRSIVTYRVGRDWLALPSVDVSSLHWRGLLADHRDPQTGCAYLRCAQGLVALLDVLPLSGVSRRLPAEFVLAVRNERPGAQPRLAALLVDEFGEVARLEGARAPLPPREPWWLRHLHADHPTLASSRVGPVPVLSAASLIVAASKWSTAGPG